MIIGFTDETGEVIWRAPEEEQQERRIIRARYRRSVKRDLWFNLVCAALFTGGLIFSLVGLIAEPGAGPMSYIANALVLTMLP